MRINLKKASVLLVIFCILFSLSACSSISIEIKNTEVEADKTLTLTDIITLSDADKYTVEVAKESADIDLGKPGKYTAKYIIKKNDSDKKIEKEVSFKVVDTTAPIIKSSKTIAFEENQVDDIDEALEITDNSSEDIEIDIEGDYDLNNVGTYNIKIIAKDSSGNESKKNIKLIIKEASRTYPSLNSNSSGSLGSLSGYWVNKPGNKFFLIKNDGNTNTILFDELKTGPGGGGVAGEIKNISTSDETTTIKYKDYDDSKIYSIKLKKTDNSSLTITSSSSLKGKYQKWSEAQMTNYWKSLGF